MRYLACHIRHEATHLGTLGNILKGTLIVANRSGRMSKSIFKGDGQIMEATSYLKSSIDSYNNALGNISLRIVIKLYELFKGTC